METQPENTLGLISVITESRTILRASFGQYVALSLFFLPLSYSLITTPIFVLDHFHKYTPYDQKDVIYYVLYVLIVYILALCATATITYSAYHDKQVNFFTAHKSLTVSFFPIVSTSILAHVLQFISVLSYFYLIGSVVITIQVFGFVIDYSSIHFKLFSAVVGVILIMCMISLHANWSLAFVVVVAESKWGFEALTRSSDLLKGMELVSLNLFLYYGSLIGLMMLVFSHRYVWTSWGLFSTLFHSSLLTLFLLQSTVANTVLYNHCKAFQGEFASGIASEESAYDYVNLPHNDDDKVDPQVVTVVTA